MSFKDRSLFLSKKISPVLPNFFRRSTLTLGIQSFPTRKFCFVYDLIFSDSNSETISVFSIQCQNMEHPWGITAVSSCANDYPGDKCTGQAKTKNIIVIMESIIVAWSHYFSVIVILLGHFSSFSYGNNAHLHKLKIL